MNDDLILRLVRELPVPGEHKEGSATLDEAKLTAVLAAARVAPSADNAQTWRFVTVASEPTRRRLGESVSDATVGAALAAAHTIVAVCGIRWVVTRARREQPFVWMDVPIALTHLLLQATELGLGCCFTLDLDEAAVREVLGIPESVRVVALVGLS